MSANRLETAVENSVDELLASVIVDSLSSLNTVGFVLLNKEGNIYKANRFFMGLMEACVAEVSSEAWDSFFASEDRQLELARSHMIICSNEGEYEVNASLLNKCGRKIDVHLVYKSLGDMGSSGYLVLVQNISYVRTLERHLKDAMENSNIQQAQTAQVTNAILKNFPNEMLAPLNSILGFADILKSHNLSEDSAECVSGVRQSALRLERFFKKYILFTQLEMPAKDTASLNFDCPYHPFTPEILSDYAQKVAELLGRGDDLVVNLKAPNIPVEEIMLDRLLSEVLENAFLYSDVGTPVELSMSTTERSLVIAVEDHGAGFSANEIAQLGTPFVRFERKSHSYTGIGLGLYLVNKLCARNGGRMNVISKPSGTRIEVLFPLPQ